MRPQVKELNINTMGTQRGRFISFEGGEGAGKTTQITRLAAFLRERGKEVLLTREPGGTALGEDVRKILKFADYGDTLTQEAEALLFSAARAQLVREVIVPALERGVYVISDRFTDSSVAYQGAGRGLGEAAVSAVNRFATGGLEPDLTVLLDLEPSVGFARVRSRAGENGDKQDRMETMELAFYERVRAAYLKLAEKFPQRFFVVEANDSADVISEKLKNEIERRLG